MGMVGDSPTFWISTYPEIIKALSDASGKNIWEVACWFGEHHRYQMGKTEIEMIEDFANAHRKEGQ